MSTTDIQSMPLNIRKELHDYDIPLGTSDRIFREIKRQDMQGNYKKVQVFPTDPEWRFVWRYFHHDKPNKYVIKRIYCIYKKKQQKDFELNLSSIEREAKTFKLAWGQESRSAQRAQAIELWKQTTDIFSPFGIMEANGRKNFRHVKIMPLWHVSSKSVCNSGSESGFIYFGKTPESESQNNDYDFSESGIYFTNSARYASDVYNEKVIFLTWVSMKEPFPIVGDSKTDIETFKKTYRDYNAYYVPVTLNYSDNDASICYSTKEKPRCDEFVVFHKSQTLPCFLVELEVELPYTPSEAPQFVNELIQHIMKLLQNPNVDRDQQLRTYLYRRLGILLTLQEDDCLEERHKCMYEKLKKILDSQGKVNSQVSYALTGTPKANISTPYPQPIKSVTPSPFNNIVSPQPFPAKHSISLSAMPTVPSKLKVQGKIFPSASSIAFGKADWEKYFGEIGLEPPLPANIEKILNLPCSFWAGKKVKETHLLVLIPSEVNGVPFTMNYLEELIKKPNNGHATRYKYYTDYAKEALGDRSYPSHWVLMTRDIIFGSKGKNYLNCCELVVNHSNKTGLHYELPHLLEATTSILMHYVRTGERLYSSLVWTYSQDSYEGRLLIVGGFAPGGLSVYSSSGSKYDDNGVACCWKF